MKTQTKFTKGPWQTEENFNCYVQTRSGCPIAVTHPHKIAHAAAVDGIDCPVLDECLANGSLIAAAPELYAMFEELLGELVPVIEQRAIGEIPRRTQRDMETIHRGIALLGKARGEA